MDTYVKNHFTYQESRDVGQDTMLYLYADIIDDYGDVKKGEFYACIEYNYVDDVLTYHQERSSVAEIQL